MKLSTSIIGRIVIIAGAVASVHILGSIWWTLIAVSRGYAYGGAWNTLADYLLGGMYQGVDFRIAIIDTIVGAVMLIAVIMMTLFVLASITLLMYWVVTGKNFLREVD